MALLLLRRAVGHDGRTGQEQANYVERVGRDAGGRLFRKYRHFRRARSLTAEFFGPFQTEEASGIEAPLPVAQELVQRIAARHHEGRRSPSFRQVIL